MESLFAPTLGLEDVQAYATQTAVALDPNAPQITPTSVDPNEVILYIVLPDNSQIGLTGNELNLLATRKVDKDGIEYEGFGVLELFEARQLETSNLHSVTLNGKGSWTLLIQQIDENTVLILDSNSLPDLGLPNEDPSGLPKDVVQIILN
jgi:hypothetical protein